MNSTWPENQPIDFSTSLDRDDALTARTGAHSSRNKSSRCVAHQLKPSQQPRHRPKLPHLCGSSKQHPLHTILPHPGVHPADSRPSSPPASLYAFSSLMPPSSPSLNFLRRGVAWLFVSLRLSAARRGEGAGVAGGVVRTRAVVWAGTRVARRHTFANRWCTSAHCTCTRMSVII